MKLYNNCVSLRKEVAEMNGTAKRVFSLFLCLVLCLSMAPASALAAEEPIDLEDPSVIPNESPVIPSDPPVILSDSEGSPEAPPVISGEPPVIPSEARDPVEISATEEDPIDLGDETDAVDLSTADINAETGVYDGMKYRIENGKVTIIGHTDDLPEELVIPETINGYPVTSINSSAFSNFLGLTNVSIPDSVTSIGLAAFGGCSFLQEIFVSAGNTAYSSMEGVLFSKDRRLLIQCPGAKSGAYSIPNSVTSIGDPEQRDEHRRRRFPGLHQSDERDDPEQRDEHRLRGFLWLQQSDKRNDPEQRDEHRRHYFFILLQPGKRDDPGQCDEHRRQRFLWLQQPDERNDPEQRDEHRRLRFLGLQQPDERNDRERCDKYWRPCLL